MTSYTCPFNLTARSNLSVEVHPHPQVTGRAFVKSCFRKVDMVLAWQARLRLWSRSIVHRKKTIDMAKNTWLKGALMLALCGSLTALGGGCLGDFVQRILVAVVVP